MKERKESTGLLQQGDNGMKRTTKLFGLRPD